MLDIYDIHDYSEDFLEKFLHQVLPVYDLWSIRALRNEQKTLIDGSTKDLSKISDFLQSESEKDYPMDLLIILGTADKSNPKVMTSRKRTYFKIKFDKNSNNELGSPGILDSNPNFNYNNQLQMFRSGIRGAGQFGNYPMSDMQGIIDKNVSDAIRSVRAEYDEIVAKKETESLKRHAELEGKFEAYKLAVQEQAIRDKHQELDERENALHQQYEEFEAKRQEGLGTVKEYTKVIAGGLLEAGKAWFGFDFGKNDEDDEKSTKPKAQNTNDKNQKDEELSNTQNQSKKDEGGGFEEFIKDDDPEIKHHQLKGVIDIEMILAAIKNLSGEDKMLLLEALMPEEEENTEKEKENKLENWQESQENNDLRQDESENENNISENNQNNVKTEKHDVQIENVNVQTNSHCDKSRNNDAQSKYHITSHDFSETESQNNSRNKESPP